MCPGYGMQHGYYGQGAIEQQQQMHYQQMMQMQQMQQCQQQILRSGDGYDGRGGGDRGGLTPMGRPSSTQQMMPGDWLCPRCGDHVFARNPSCRRCGAPRPDGACMPSDANGGSCYGGGGSYGGACGPPPRPANSNQRALPGDWHCPRCKDLQFARNAQCRMCGCPKPEQGRYDITGEYSGGGPTARSRSRSRSHRRSRD